MLPQRPSPQFPFENGQLSEETFNEIRNRYLKETGYTIVYSDVEGNLIYGLPNCREFPCLESCRLARQQSIEMALSYGLPFPTRCPITYLFLAIPISINNQVIGALITVGDKLRLNQKEVESDDQRIKSAQDKLIEIAEQFNIVNRAFLQQRQTLIDSSRDRSGHTPRPLSTPKIPQLEELWNRENASLMDSIAKGDFPETKRLIGKIITILKDTDETTLPEAKGFSLELFASVVEYSLKHHGNRNHHFLFHYESAEKIITCNSAVELCDCICELIQIYIQATQSIKTKDRNNVVGKLYAYIERNLNQPLNREQVAAAIGMSASRLSHILKEEENESYSEILTRFRMEHGRKLLIEGDDAISSIAMECGYCDQSHFTKVFQKTFGASPKLYRDQYRS